LLYLSKICFLPAQVTFKYYILSLFKYITTYILFVLLQIQVLDGRRGSGFFFRKCGIGMADAKADNEKNGAYFSVREHLRVGR